MRPHETLEAWRQSVDFVVSIYRITEAFPKEEKFGLTSQIRRAVVSIPANIAEGAGHHSEKEFDTSFQTPRALLVSLRRSL